MRHQRSAAALAIVFAASLAVLCEAQVGQAATRGLIPRAAASATPRVGPVPIPTVSYPALPSPSGAGHPEVKSQQTGGQSLVGTFAIQSGACAGSGAPNGTWFEMLSPSGSTVDNGNSPCSNQAYTPLKAGTIGFSTEQFEPFASNPSSSDAIVAPATFFGSPFAVATETPDKQTSQPVPLPTITDNAGQLSGQVEAWQVYYNTQYYNQGAPKPGGATSGGTTNGISGSYNSSTGYYSITWKSTIKGGGFNGFTGVWHLQGTFTSSSHPAAAQASPSPATSAPSGAASGGTSPAGTSSTSAASGTGSGQSLAFTGPVIPEWLAGLVSALGLLGVVWLRRSRRSS
ncbi:MAG: hypothetical protein ACYCO3_07695 [Mycobacteriales bacterium]